MCAWLPFFRVLVSDIFIQIHFIFALLSPVLYNAIMRQPAPIHQSADINRNDITGKDPRDKRSESLEKSMATEMKGNISKTRVN